MGKVKTTSKAEPLKQLLYKGILKNGLIRDGTRTLFKVKLKEMKGGINKNDIKN